MTAFEMGLVGVTNDSDAVDFTYGWQEAIRYALSIGATRDELDFLYEGRGPKVFPSFALVPAIEPVIHLLDRVSAGNRVRVHSGQGIAVHAQLPPSGTLTVRCTVQAVQDLGKHASVVIGSSVSDASGALLVEGTWSFLFPGGGGFSPKATPIEEASQTARPPLEDTSAAAGGERFRIAQASSPEQALLYRLNYGDLNPLHADPEVAKARGFDAPILQGPCTFGYTLRAVVRGACGGDVTRLSSLEGQFRRPAWPGDTFVTEGAPFEPGRWAVTTHAEGRAEPIIARAIAVTT